jgi:hypothetical protein
MSVWLLAISGWLTGRKELGLLRALRVQEWNAQNVVLVVTAVAVGGVASNLLATMISDHGWVETFARHSVKAGLYATLILVCALVTTIVVVR